MLLSRVAGRTASTPRESGGIGRRAGLGAGSRKAMGRSTPPFAPPSARA